MQNIYDVIVRPVISEKSTALAEVANKYVFHVALKSNKHEIKNAVQKIFGVHVKQVRTLVMHVEARRTNRGELKAPNWKKAIVTLADGQKIDFFQAK